MLSQTVEYALRAVCHLAVTATPPKSGNDLETPSTRFEPQTTEQIASVTLVPKAYLAKVMQQLSRSGIVQSHRGVRGGFSLAKSPESLSLLEVVNAVEPLQRINTCPLGLAAHGKVLCPLHHRLDQAMAATEEAFRNTYLSEVLAEPGRSIPFVDVPACHFPTVKTANETEPPREPPPRIEKFAADTVAVSPPTGKATVSASAHGTVTANPGSSSNLQTDLQPAADSPRPPGDSH